MTLEYLAEGSPDCPLIRLFDFTHAVVELLQGQVANLATGCGEQVAVHDLHGVEVVDDLKLWFRRSNRDRGLSAIGAAALACELTADRWGDMAAMIAPFTKSAGGFQWLPVGAASEIRLLISSSGEW